ISGDKQIAKRKLADAETELNKSRDEYSKYQNFQVSNPDAYKQHHKGKLEEYENLINVHTASKERSKAELAKLNDALPTREQFVELVHSYLETLLNTTDL